MKQYISLDQWVALSQAERKQVMSVFPVRKSGSMHVENNQIISDGVTQADLALINIGHMIEYIGSEDDTFCDDLWELVKEKLFGLKKINEDYGNTSDQ